VARHEHLGRNGYSGIRVAYAVDADALRQDIEVA
jgi:hypothetical protein